MALNIKYAVDYNLSKMVEREGKLDLSYREFTNAGVTYLSRAISGMKGKDHAESLTDLNLCKSHVDDDCIPALIRIVKRARHLKNLNISDNAITGAGMEQLCQALEGHPSVKLLNIGSNPLGDRGGKAIASLIRSGDSHIEELQAHHASIGDAGLAAIGQAFSRTETAMERVNLMSNKGAAAAGHAWSNAILSNTSLSSVHLSQDNPLFDELVKDALATSRNPNLTYVSPVDGRVAERTGFNRTGAIKAANLLVKKPETLTYDDRAFTLQRITAAQRTLVNGLPPYKYHLSRFEGLLDAMPPLPPANANFSEALFKPNASGYAPLDNPKNWKDWDVVMKGLVASQTRPTKDFLQKTTPHGVTFLQSAAGMVSSEQVTSYLLKHGGKLGSHELLDAENKPSALFRAFINRGDVGGIFAQDNWMGKSQNELTSVYSAVPEALRKDISIHTLRQSIRPVHQGRGR